MINTSVQDWSRNPVVTSIDTTAAPNSEVDFPAITACEEMPRKHESWEVPTLIFNSIDFLTCDSDDCDESVFKENKAAFKDFLEELVDKYLEGEDYSEGTYTETSYCAPECVGEKRPGVFSLPEGYNGVTHGFLYFHVAYCDLVIQIDNKTKTDPNTIQEIEARWVDSITSPVNFSVEILAVEFGVQYDFGSSTVFDLFKVDTCYLDENQNDIMRLLAKIYLLNADVIFAKFGTTMRLLVEFGKLNVQPYSNGYFPSNSSDSRVSFCCEMCNSRLLCSKYLSNIFVHICREKQAISFVGLYHPLVALPSVSMYQKKIQCFMGSSRRLQ